MQYPHLKKLQQLDALLEKYIWLWQPQAFKHPQPPWCAHQPQLTHALLQLSETQVLSLSSSTQHALSYLSQFLPEIKTLIQLTHLPLPTKQQTPSTPAYLSRSIPGRKWQQILNFSNALALDETPLLEWCGGKGHLGRLLAYQYQLRVHTLERQTTLCEQGQTLSSKAHVQQHFTVMDVMHTKAGQQLVGHHPIALHACGELHRKLLRDSLQQNTPQLSFAPCCYHLGLRQTHYIPLTTNLSLRPRQEDLRLAVTETVTARAREVRQRDHEMHWKLSYDLLRRDLRQEDTYRPIPPIKKAWLTLSFKQFCKILAEREALTLPAQWQEDEYLKKGKARQDTFFRLAIPRQAFRRAIELWLVLDMCVELERHGYQVKISQFCTPALSPRNLLVQARKA